MSMVHGYTHATVLVRTPANTYPELLPHIQKLNENGVKGVQGGSPPPKNYSISDNSSGLRTNLKQVLDKSKSKIDDMMQHVSSEALRGGINEKINSRLSNMSEGQVEMLKERLHYSRSEAKSSGTTPEERVAIRTTLLLAFAHGANSDELARMKDFLNSADPATRAKFLDALNKPEAHPTQILNDFQKGTFQTPSDGIDQMKSLAGKAEWAFNISKVDIDNYLTQNAKALGLEGVSKNDPKYQEAYLGVLALTTYTSEAYAKINKELMNQNNRLGEVSPEVETLTRAGTEFMAKLPDFQGIVCRGGGSGWQEKALEKYVPGQVVTEQMFISSSSDKGFPGSIQFIIESKHGKDVTDISCNSGGDGKEVLFPPGTKFEVIGVVQSESTKTWDGDMLVNNKNKQGEIEKTIYIVLREVD